LIARKRLLLQLLDITHAHKRVSDTLTGLHYHIADMYAISELRQQALTKMQLFESIIDNAKELICFSVQHLRHFSSNDLNRGVFARYGC
jgi:hypothetical protein